MFKNIDGTVLFITPVVVYAPVFHPSFRLPIGHITIIGYVHVISHDTETGILAVFTGH